MWDDSFIEYTNVFRSRIAHGNLVSSNNDNRQKDLIVLEGTLRRKLFRPQILSRGNEKWSNVLRYFLDKGFLGLSPKKSGRFKSLLVREEAGEFVLQRGEDIVSEISVTPVDLHFSDPRVHSTIGVPTEENLSETISAAVDFSFCNKKGQNLRLADLAPNILKLVGQESDNPYLVAKLDVMYFYALMRSDYFVSYSLCKALHGKYEFSRNDILEILPDVVRDAISLADLYFPNRTIIRALKEHHALLQGSLTKLGDSSSRGPGVLEHRLSPRLEYLVDVGLLTKKEKRNSFHYQTDDGLGEFLDRVKDFEEKPDFIGLLSAYLGARGGRDVAIGFGEILEVYKEVGPRVGSMSIDHLAIAVMSRHRSTNVQSFFDSLFAEADEKHVRFTGGRYNRSAEYVWIDVRSAPIR